MSQHTNSRYEYTIREYATYPSFSEDAGILSEGWIRVWSDTMMEGCFMVYRRERATQGAR
jgi:hypothetical protein